MSKRLLWLLAALVAALALVAAGCGGDDDEEGAGETTAPATDTGDAGQAGEGTRVCLVTDIGGLNDRGFNSLANQGLERAKSELGVETRVLESKSDADYIPNLSECAEQGYNLIISVGFLMGEATETAANEYPDVNFAIIDNAYEAAPSNLQGLLFKEQEAGYLVGYMAALASESGTISSVGGQKIPPVDRFIAGYQKAAQDAKDGVTTLNGYSQDFVDQAKCKEVALDQIAKGSDVVFQVAGGCGLGAIDAAKEKGVWGIGVDADQAFLGDHVLTSATKKVDVAVFDTIEKQVNGEFEGGGVTTFGLAEDGVGLGEISPKFTDQEIIDQVEEQKQMIIDGEIEIPETVG
ncbi:MAG TPA: BMP family ABC transporter substrate-binding protein [Gaiellaceae bacterium]|nr:BMP family ABC transporter substrate-binding protein [Gaiellaceae bacterium]